VTRRLRQVLGCFGLPGKRATPTDNEASSLPSGASECTYSTPPYSGLCGRHLAIEKLGALEPKKSAEELHLEALVPTAPDSLKANLRHDWPEAVVRLWEHPNLKSEFDEVYGVGMGDGCWRGGNFITGS
jgi:hypothetical protein